ncbi:mechanosensitive ion channel family protein [Actinopolymorpha sp. B17G11]|uniref:mechanosensitive ion channel family protein n=1 Tax=Actinopolymorpha sp. B17G11 TaxID=3160861 RepID=UPI0032E4CA36
MPCGEAERMWRDVWQGFLVVVVTCAGTLLAGWLSAIVVRWTARRRRSTTLFRVHRTCRRAWTAVLVTTGLFVVLPLTGWDRALVSQLRHALILAMIAAAAWLVLRMLFVVEDAAFQWLRVDVTNNRRVRRRRTQIAILRRLTTGLVVVIAFSAMLMTFAGLRALGASLLASAGVLGAIAGFAAHATLGNVFAGLQVAMTDALRYDDVVVVENEWGRIEELTLTYVVVRLWDERRLVLPTAYFTTTPFQNWTRNEAKVVGTVELQLDYRTPIAEVRAEARRIIQASPLWDRREWVVQVVESTPWTMVVRILASAADAPSSWDLSCDVRERLISYLQTHHPEALPRPSGRQQPP